MKPVATAHFAHVDKLVLQAGTMSPDSPLTQERSVMLAHEAARLGYPAAKIESGGITHLIFAKFDARLEVRRIALVNRPAAPLRPGFPVRATDTETVR